eukprot:scaffold8637_cov127-Isochrysis_galbana.AAC.2
MGAPCCSWALLAIHRPRAASAHAPPHGRGLGRGGGATRPPRLVFLARALWRTGPQSPWVRHCMLYLVVTTAPLYPCSLMPPSAAPWLPLFVRASAASLSMRLNHDAGRFKSSAR